MNFWDDLFVKNKMVLGLSPMDGVTDVAMRYMTAKYSCPDLLFTEFVSVDALHYATGERRERLLKTFMRVRNADPYRETPPTFGVPTRDSLASPVEESPFPYEIAQVFGHTPELFAEAAVIVEKMGFDGIDINMGCPMHKVEDQGSGAGLIRTPKLAQEIIRTVKSATKLPVSVKTRIGMNSDVAEEWMSALMEEQPTNISLHGRTLRQLYSGKSDWEAIGRAAVVVHKHGGHILGNGDVESLQDAKDKSEKYGVDGVLIGRAAEGNPGIFLGINEPSKEQRFAWMIEHARVFESVFTERVDLSKFEQSTSRNQPSKSFMPMRKHLAWYCKGFPGAVEMRTKLMLSNSAHEVESILRDFQK